MRRERTRGGRVALAFAGGALGVLLWSWVSASAPSDAGEPLPGAPGLAAPSSPPRWRHASLEEPAALAASRLVTTLASWTPDASSASASALEPSPGSSAASSLAGAPASSSPFVEHASDGLPVSAMRCTQSARGLECGVCRTDGDCPAGQGCVANRQTRRFECMASECEEDVGCQPGTVCRSVTTGATGSLVHRCVPEGVRREGESCDALAASSASACHEGLRCVNQVCSLPCALDGSVRCAPGFVCGEGLDGPGCFPDCQQRGCPEGERCSLIRDNEYQCLAKAEGDCRDTPCAEGERCNLRLSRGRAVFWCARRCNPMLPDACASGEVCGVGSPTVSTCFRQCDPRDAQACGTGASCSTVTEDMSVFGCVPDVPR